jgi:cysteine sulfinate desulfinase/cysteine desulfurase-like protein
LEQEGYEVTDLAVEEATGRVDIDTLKAAIRDDMMILISVMAVNNEIGTVQPLEVIGELYRLKKIGSACIAASLVEPSYVLLALRVDDELAHSSLQIGISRFTSESARSGLCVGVARESRSAIARGESTVGDGARMYQLEGD